MDWNGLKTFLAIVETGSLSGAAKVLGVNHSTVYRRLQALEDSIGSTLFDMQGNRYVLTQTGEELGLLADGINKGFNDIDRLLIGKELQPKGHVRITAPFNLANRYIPEALADFRTTYPEISLELLSSNQEVNMNSRIADIAVRATSSPPEHLVGRKVATLPWGIVASACYLRNSPPLQSLADLIHHPLIGGAGDMRYLPAFTWLDKHHPERIMTRSDELTAMAYLAEQGHGVAFLPKDQMRPGLEWLMDFTETPASDIWVLTHPDLRKTERIKLVMSHLAQYFYELVKN